MGDKERPPKIGWGFKTKYDGGKTHVYVMGPQEEGSPGEVTIAIARNGFQYGFIALDPAETACLIRDLKAAFMGFTEADL